MIKNGAGGGGSIEPPEPPLNPAQFSVYFVCVMVYLPHSSMGRSMFCDCCIYLVVLTRFVA